MSESKMEVLNWLQSLYEAAVESGLNDKAEKIKKRIEILKE